MRKPNTSSNVFSEWLYSTLPLQPLPSCCSTEVKKLVCSWSLYDQVGAMLIERLRSERSPVLKRVGRPVRSGESTSVRW
ncbi:hypothetical protein D3C77_640410 [compost metagenome]